MEFKQELADVQAAIEKVEAAEAPAQAAPVALGKVTLRHPHSGDTVEVDATPGAMTPYMVRGYAQFNAAQPAEAK